MRKYIARRVFLIAPTLFIVTIIIFSLIRLIPGDVVTIMFEDLAYAADEDALREKLGLNKPIHVQYGEWMWGMVGGDFGESLYTGRPAIDMVKEKLPVTLELGIITILFSVTSGVSLGILAALRQDDWVDFVSRSTAIGFLAMPTFWIGTLVMILPAKYFGWSPNPVYVPFFDDPMANLKQFAVPALILGTHLGAPVMRMTRAMMLEVFRQDYVRTARAKGLAESGVVYRHALKNAMIPVITILGDQLELAIGGTVIMETIFQLPGMGGFLLGAITTRDYPLVQSLVIIIAVAVMIINLLVDLAYGWLDPRIRYG